MGHCHWVMYAMQAEVGMTTGRSCWHGTEHVGSAPGASLSPVPLQQPALQLLHNAVIDAAPALLLPGPS